MLDLDPRLRELLDRREIVACLERYCRGIDRRDWELVRSAFHDDAIEQHHDFLGSPDEFIEWIAEFMAGRESNQHLLGNHTIDFDGDIAHTESYLMASRLIGDSVTLTAGRYLCRFERRQEWKIAARVTVIDWIATFPGKQEYQLKPRFDEADISYHRPLNIPIL